MSYEPKPGTPVQELDTPALILDLDKFQRNVDKMARFFANKPTVLRPHSKTHKCPQIAQRQLAAGAVGITCAKVSEASVMAQAGIRSILIANEIVGPAKIERLTELARQATMYVAVDDPNNIRALSVACHNKGVQLGVLIEVDIGMKRCGVQAGPVVIDLARQIADAPGLTFSGILAYEGHLVMVQDPEERARRVRHDIQPLNDVVESLEKHGLPAKIVSGGGTGTYDISGTCPPMTEIEAGSYVFMDTTYLKIRPEFESSLTLLVTVISRPTPERVIVDAGMKSITHEFGLPQPVDVPGAALRSLSEEHGKIELADPAAISVPAGSKMRVIPSHCCTTVNLHDKMYVCQQDVLVDIWPIAARGCVQ
jgi:D-serine deaminase-like pyridoxal phosphate-dependent protein